MAGAARTRGDFNLCTTTSALPCKFPEGREQVCVIFPTGLFGSRGHNGILGMPRSRDAWTISGGLYTSQTDLGLRKETHRVK